MLELAMLLIGASVSPISDTNSNNSCFVIERINALTLYDIWHSSQTGPVYNDAGQVLSFWVADPESARRDNGWTSQSIVMFGWGDIGEEPTALLVSARTDVLYSAEYDLSVDTLGAAFELQISLPPLACGESETGNRISILVSAGGGYTVQ